MNDFFEEMKAYLENTPHAEIEKMWAKYNIPENNVGPTMDAFLEEAILYHCSSQEPIYESSQNLIDTNYNPKYSSGFFLPKKLTSYAKSSVFYHQLSI